MKFINLGVLAHVDAGKTSLTERLLFNAGVINRIGSVDHGDTQTDSLILERQRGITIQSAVVAFRIGDLQVNLIDTPGHSDFVAEVERAMRVLDGAVLVISAVEGVQARTRVLMRSLVKLGIPTLLFVNKIDRMGARYGELLDSIHKSIAPNLIAMSAVEDIGSPSACASPLEYTDEHLAMALSEMQPRLLDEYLNRDLSRTDLMRELQMQARSGRIHPVFFGSAVTGEGVADLTNAIADLLPTSAGDAESPLKADVFKIERGHNNEKIAYARVREGTLNARHRLPVWTRGVERQESDGRATAVRVFTQGTVLRDQAASAGAVAKVWGLKNVQVGDRLGSPDDADTSLLFPRPTLETIVRANDSAMKSELFAALQILAEQDPLIAVRRDETSRAIAVSLYGEVQKEVIGETLLDSFGIEVTFEESRTIYVERPVGIGNAMQEFDVKTANFFWATIGLHVEPGEIGSGVRYEVGKLRGLLPLSFHKAIEESIRETLRQGPHGWEVVDCRVHLTRVGFDSVISNAGHFRDLAALLIAEALQRAGTIVCEPIHRYELEMADDVAGDLLVLLAQNRASIEEQEPHRLSGIIPAANIHSIASRLADLTHGEGTLTTDFESYRPIVDKLPFREHVGANPYIREQYMLHVSRRMV